MIARQNGKTSQLADVLEQLQAENAKLRDEFRKMDEWHSKELAAAIDENAKLRELVRDLWEFGCGPNSGANSAAEWAEIADALRDRMHELGVE